MSFGLEIKDENGQSVMSTSDFTYRVIHSEIITITPAAQTITRTVAGFSSASCAAIIYHESPQAYASDPGPYINALIPHMSISGENITIRARHPSGGGSSGTSLGPSGAAAAYRLICVRGS